MRNFLLEQQDNGNGRIEALKERQRQLQAALAAEHLKLAKRHKREDDKEQSIIGAAVVKAAAVFPEFRKAVTATALATIEEEKQRQFLIKRGWPL